MFDTDLHHSPRPADGLSGVRDVMAKSNVDPVAIDFFSRAYQRLESGETGAIPETTIEPLQLERLSPDWSNNDPQTGPLAQTAIIKLNGGLGTSMGLDRAKSLLVAREGLTFLDVIARQVLAARRRYAVQLPVIFMNSFRTSADTMTALAAYPELKASDLPLEILQNRVPKLRVDDLSPVSWPAEPDLEWCPPGHGDLYAVLRSTGLARLLQERGFTQLFVSNADNLGAIAEPRTAEWFASSGAPFAIESVRRTASDRKGGHFARRIRDGRIVLRETAQTLPEDLAALADLTRHKFCSTNNLWMNLRALEAEFNARAGVLDLPLIRNVKTVDPTKPASTPVIQLESAMGAAIELFEGAQSVEVDRSRFVPVKSTDDLMLLRSDCYGLDENFRLRQQCEELPFIELAAVFRHIDGFEHRFPQGVPSLVRARSLMVEGDWTVEGAVVVEGDVRLGPTGGVIPTASLLRDERR